MSDNHSPRRWLIWALRIAALVLVAVGVRGTVDSALAQLSQHEWHVRPAWLVASGAIYVLGLLPMAWFWHRTLQSLGQPAPLSATLWAYSLGHLGKYVPGKAMAVILRIAAVRKWVSSKRIAIVSTFLETLTMMAVGAAVAAALSLLVLELELRLAAIAAIIAMAAGFPTLPPVARRLARLGMERVKQPAGNDIDSPTSSIQINVEESLRGINAPLLFSGWIAAAACWSMLGLSLWATLRAIGVDTVDPFSDFPLTVAASAFAVVAGFASMLPGGLVVRDAVLMQLLAPICGAANALVAAVLLRLVWLVSELAACVILYVVARIR